MELMRPGDFWMFCKIGHGPGSPDPIQKRLLENRDKLHKSFPEAAESLDPHVPKPTPVATTSVSAAPAWETSGVTSDPVAARAETRQVVDAVRAKYPPVIRPPSGPLTPEQLAERAAAKGPLLQLSTAVQKPKASPWLPSWLQSAPPEEITKDTLRRISETIKKPSLPREIARGLVRGLGEMGWETTKGLGRGYVREGLERDYIRPVEEFIAGGPIHMPSVAVPNLSGSGNLRYPSWIPMVGGEEISLGLDTPFKMLGSALPITSWQGQAANSAPGLAGMAGAVAGNAAGPYYGQTEAKVAPRSGARFPHMGPAIGFAQTIKNPQPLVGEELAGPKLRNKPPPVAPAPVDDPFGYKRFPDNP